MVDTKAPISKTFLPFSNATVTIATWPDGHQSVQLQIDSRLRNGPDASAYGDDPESQDRLQKARDKADDFQKYGRIDLYPSDAMNLAAVTSALLPKTGGLEVRL